MNHVEHVTALGQPVEAVCFTSDDGTAQLRAGLSLRSGLIVELAGGAGRQQFRCDPEQADALGRWLVEKAAEYRGAPDAWVTGPAVGRVPPSALAGFDTLALQLQPHEGLTTFPGNRERAHGCID